MSFKFRGIVEEYLDNMLSDDSLNTHVNMWKLAVDEGWISSPKDAMMGYLWGVFSSKINSASMQLNMSVIEVADLTRETFNRRVPEIKHKLNMILNV